MADMSLGLVSVSSMSKIQKLNPRSSTEVELIWSENMHPEFLCSRYSI